MPERSVFHRYNNNITISKMTFYTHSHTGRSSNVDEIIIKAQCLYFRLQTIDIIYTIRSKQTHTHARI